MEKRLNSVRLAFEEVIEALRRESVALFCGAGISSNSGLPLAGQIVDAFLEELDASAAQRAAIVESQLPFELFMETLSREKDVQGAFETFAEGSFNRNHAFFAHLLSSGATQCVFTTNFDCLIEDALRALHPNLSYQLLDDERSLESVEWSTSRPRVVKVHGTIRNFRDMAFTLTQVAQRQLAAARGIALDYVFKSGPHDLVVVMGYSGSDRFDVTPRLESYAGGKKRLLVIDHGRDHWQAEELGARSSPDPFRSFDGIRLLGSTDEFVEMLWSSSLGGAPPAMAMTRPNSWRAAISDWGAGLAGASTRVAIIARLMFVAGRPRIGVAALEDAPPEQSKVARVVFTMNRGAGLGASGRYAESLETLEQAYKLAQDLDYPPLTGQVLLNVALAKSHSGEAEVALTSAIEAAGLLRAGGYEAELGAAIDCGGMCLARLGRYAEALRCAEVAVDLFEEIGNVAFRGVATGNLALHLEKLSRTEDALVKHREALEISTSAGDAVSVARHMSNIRRLSKDTSLETPGESSPMARVGAHESLDDRAIDVHNSANALVRAGQAREAIPLYDEAISLSRSSGNVDGLILQLHNQALALIECREPALALESLSEAIEVASKIGSHNAAIDAMVSLAKLNLDYGMLRNALSVLEEVVRVMSETGQRGSHDPENIRALVEEMRADPNVL